MLPLEQLFFVSFPLQQLSCRLEAFLLHLLTSCRPAFLGKLFVFLSWQWLCLFTREWPRFTSGRACWHCLANESVGLKEICNSLPCHCEGLERVGKKKMAPRERQGTGGHNLLLTLCACCVSSSAEEVSAVGAGCRYPCGHLSHPACVPMAWVRSAAPFPCSHKHGLICEHTMHLLAHSHVLCPTHCCGRSGVIQAWEQRKECHLLTHIVPKQLLYLRFEADTKVCSGEPFFFPATSIHLPFLKFHT